MDKVEEKSSPDLQQKPSNNTKKSAVWDCGSSLYDSFELDSLNRQLHSSLTARITPSMGPLPAPAVPREKTSTRFARSMCKLLRSVLKWRPTAGAMVGKKREVSGRNSASSRYPQWSIGGLETIPEGCEESPEFEPTVRKTASDRFAGYSGERIDRILFSDINTSLG